MKIKTPTDEWELTVTVHQRANFGFYSPNQKIPPKDFEVEITDPDEFLEVTHNEDMYWHTLKEDAALSFASKYLEIESYTISCNIGSHDDITWTIYDTSVVRGELYSNDPSWVEIRLEALGF